MEQNSEQNSLTWAKKRQIVILIILFVVIFASAILVGFWLFDKQPTCFDGKQNGEETGIDCGGRCSLVCSGLAKDPLINFTRLFKSIHGYSAVAHIENQNDLVVHTAKYSFKLYDANGALIGVRSGAMFVPQHSSFPIFEANIDTKGVEPAKVFFAFDDGLMWEKSTYVPPKLLIEDEKLSGEKTEPRLTANVTNPTVREIKNIDVTTVLYDDGGNAVNSSKTKIDSILPNQKVQIFYTWPYPLPESLHVCVQPVDVALIIDRSGSMADLGKTPPQPLTDVKNAADFFVKQLNDKDQATVVSFANQASTPMDIPLTSDLQAVVGAIDQISIHKDGGQNTNISDGLTKAYDELHTTRHNENSSKVIILLTDGIANLPTKKGSPNFASDVSVQIANKIKSDSTTLFTIGLGKDIKKDFLSAIASAPEDAFFAPTAGELSSIYQTIGTKICKRGTSRIEISPLIPPQSSQL